MGKGLLFDSDDQVMAFVDKEYSLVQMKFDRAIGIIEKGQLVGGVIFQNYNTVNVDGSYYGRKTLTPGIVRVLARFVILNFNVARVTVLTSKRNKRLGHALRTIGFKLEGVQRRYYGTRDCDRNTAVRFVAFKERLEEIARFEPQSKVGMH